MVLVNFALNVLEPHKNLSATIKGIFVPLSVLKEDRGRYKEGFGF